MEIKSNEKNRDKYSAADTRRKPRPLEYAVLDDDVALDDAVADVESYIVNGGYETVFDGKERHTLLMDKRKALAAFSEIKSVLREAGHRV